MSNSKKKEKVLSLLSSSFDRNQQAESANKRENLKLQAEQQNLELYKSEALRAICANEAKLRLSSQRLLEKRHTSLTKELSSNYTASSLTDLRISKTPASLATGIQRRCLFNASRALATFNHDISRNDKNPTTSFSSAAGKNRNLKLPGISQRKALVMQQNSSAQSTSDIKEGFVNSVECNDNSDDLDRVMTPNQTRRTNRNLEKMATLETPRLSSRRRSLSLNDLSLAERINSFLESVELAKNSSEEEIDSS